MDDFRFFRIERDGAVAVAVFDKPPANTLDYAVYEELSLLCSALEADDSVRAVVFESGNEKIFVSGADIGDMADYDRRRGPLAHKVDTVSATFLRVQRLAKPTVGAITGHALGGGCELSLCFDFRVMTDGRPRIGLPEVSLGIVPGGGGTQRLARLIGRAAATELIMLGKRLTAGEAMAIGLVNEACPDVTTTKERARELAGELARQAPLALRLVKRALNDGVDGDLVAGLAVEREAVIEVLQSEDAREGVTAFLEKRDPRFEGR